MTDDTAADVAICYTTQKPVDDAPCPRGLDECEGEACEEYFIAYSG